MRCAADSGDLLIPPAKTKHSTSSAPSGHLLLKEKALVRQRVGTQMNGLYNGKLISNAKKLRKTMTKEERHLWYDCLKQLPVTVHRQKVFGNYIVDFYIASHKIVIELDGSQHYEEEHRQRDLLRDLYFQQMGCKVLRYSNADINQRFDCVCEDIWNNINKEK